MTALLCLGNMSIDTLPAMVKISGATVSYNVAEADAAQVLMTIMNAGAIGTFNLPAVSSVTPGKLFMFTNGGANGPACDCKVARNGSDTIQGTLGDFYVAADEYLCLTPDVLGSNN